MIEAAAKAFNYHSQMQATKVQLCMLTHHGCYHVVHVYVSILQCVIQSQSQSQTGLGMRPSCDYPLAILQCQALERELQFHKSVYELQLNYVEMLFDAMRYVFGTHNSTYF